MRGFCDQEWVSWIKLEMVDENGLRISGNVELERVRDSSAYESVSNLSR